MPVVTFDPVEFKNIYPQFADFTDEQLEFSFDVACLTVDNTEGSIVPYNPPATKTRKTILYLLVCHLCELSLRGNGLTGPITSASEGSVSASFGTLATSANAGWFQQTQCGATAWQLMQQFMLGGRLYVQCD